MFGTPASRPLAWNGGLQGRWGMTNRLVTVLQRSSTQGMTGNTWTTVNWNVRQKDEVGAWVASNPTVVTVRAGWTRARLKMTSNWAINSSTSESCYIQAQKNGAVFQNAISRSIGGSLGNTSTNGAGTFLDTGWLVGLSVGDAFLFQVLIGAAGGVGFGANNSWPTLWVEWAP